ncbi:major allergen I polypeptide chain 1-like [Mus caroli]|uniref:ABPA24 n=1 Tax=Mus caroli TaxID=10089 RepID=A0A6M4RS65_MUSCR|nr:major allergen I polypeptide chain 1-like [Mus caroli]QJS38978.1 ABPA24 [Mus caroli]
MKLDGALFLLRAALLLTSGVYCGICPDIKQDAHLFFHWTPEEYFEYVKQYKDDPEILENTEKIKKCVHSTLTNKDKTHATAFIEKIEASPAC